jgi:hypothetical protein
MHMMLLIALLLLQKAAAFYNVHVPQLRPLGLHKTAAPAVSPFAIDTTSYENYGSWAPPLKVCSVFPKNCNAFVRLQDFCMPHRAAFA